MIVRALVEYKIHNDDEYTYFEQFVVRYCKKGLEEVKWSWKSLVLHILAKRKIVVTHIKEIKVEYVGN